MALRKAAIRTAQTQTEAPRDGPRPRSVTGFPVLPRRPAQFAQSPVPIGFDASFTAFSRPPRPSFVGPSASRSCGDHPPLAPSLTGISAGPWILGPPSRSRPLPVALVALRPFRTFALAVRYKVCIGHLFGCLGLFLCAQVPQTPVKIASDLSMSREPRISCPQKANHCVRFAARAKFSDRAGQKIPRCRVRVRASRHARCWCSRG